MKKNKKHRILSAIGAVACVVSMILSVTVLPAIAYANVTKNPLFAAVLAAAENNRGQSKSGEGGADEGGAGKEVKGDKTKEVDKKEGNSAAKGEAAKDSEGVDNKSSKGNSENPNGGSVDNGSAGKDADTAGKSSKSGKDASKDASKAAVKSGESDKSDKASKKDSKDANKAKGKNRSAGDIEKLTLKQVKVLPACVAYLLKDDFDNAAIQFRPSYGHGDKCAISADELSSNFDSIRQEISKLGDNGSVNFWDAYVYAYGRLSKDGVGLFSGKNISNIDSINKFDISYVTDMSYLFKDSSLSNFSFLSSWGASSVTNMESMFEGCTNLDDISGLSGWNVSKVTNMSNMFEGCVSLSSLEPLKNWNVSNVTNMQGMFASVIKDEDKRDSFDPDGYAGEMTIASLEPLKNWNVGKVINMNRMFEGCTSLNDFTGLEKWDTKNVFSMIGMFEYCKSISSFEPLKNWNVSKVTDMRAMFALCEKIKNTVGLENWNVSNVEKMDGMFAMCTHLNSIKGLDNWNKTNSSTSKLTSTFRMFYECSGFSDLAPLKDWDVSKVTDMHYMFYNCGSVTSLDPLKGWNVNSVENMSNMFSGCNGLTSLENLSSWDVSNVTDMSSMFNSCKHLNKLDGLGNWNVSNVTNMSGMFGGCYDYEVDAEGDVTNETGLADISALSNWATKLGSVTDMSSMFSDCGLLSSLSSLKYWNVSNVENMSNMFSHSNVIGTDKLTDISALSGWDVKNVTDMSKMFSDCKSLTGDADLSKWDISKVTNLSSMFSGVGAQSGDKLVLDFSNKIFTKSSKSVYKDDDGTKHYFSVDSMFDGFKGTLIANNLKSSGFENNPDDDPIAKHFASGDIFSIDEKGHSNNIVVTNNVTILDTISNDDDLKKITYYIPVKAKLMEPGDIKNDNMTCDCNRDLGGTTYTYYVPALYNSSNLEKKQDEKSQDYAYRIVKNSFASKFRSAIDSQSGEVTGGEEPGEEGAAEEESGGEGTDYGSRSATLKLRVKKLQSVRDGEDEEGGEGGESEGSETGEEHGNAYKIMFKKPASSGDTCSWTELGDGDSAVPVSNPKSPLIFFTTTYYLETFVQPVPLPHTGGQSAVMFTFLSIGLFSMFAVSGAFARHGWVARRPA